VIVVMDHLTRKGEPKLLAECTLPLTGRGVVQRVITDLGVLDVADGEFRLVELAPGVTLEQVRSGTGAPVVDARPVAV
jgi:3-oxoacid CoA-transferase subunit B